MVALVISAVLIGGASQLYVSSRSSYGTNETVSRLQEASRYAMSVLEPDIRLANSYGLMKSGSSNDGRAPQSAATSAVAPGASANACGRNFAVDLRRAVEGDNNSYVLSSSIPSTRNASASCDNLSGWATTPVPTSDTLTIRRASAVNSALKANTLQLCSTRVTTVLSANLAACTAAPGGQINDLVVHAYYVDRNSSQGNGMPSLRRKTLTSVGGAVQFIDQEVMIGVEDMQVQFGIDPAGNTGVATRYVNPDVLAGFLNANGQVVAVRLWLLVRADAPETAFSDNRVYAYGDRLVATGTTGNITAAGVAGQAFQPSLDGNNTPTGIKRYRRILISRTIQIRNAMGI
jgi:type IV pilus assembly protein PilW